MKYDIYVTYALINKKDGYSSAIHCNYINKITVETDNIYTYELLFEFDKNEFIFLNDFNNGFGYCATDLYIIYQTVKENQPRNNVWKYKNVTNQIPGHGTVKYFTNNKLYNKKIRVELKNNNPSYTLNNPDILYKLKYPSKNETDKLSFGEETFFLGNVTADIKADVYVLDMSINLALNEFNSSNNLTWDGTSSVYISEVGLYDENKNLVAIGKLNNPIQKDSTISKTILFALDF